MAGGRTSACWGSPLMSPRHLKTRESVKMGPVPGLGAIYLTLGSPSDRPGSPAASSCNRAPARILEFLGLWRRGGRASCIARSFIEGEGCFPSGDSCCDEFRGHLQNAKTTVLSPLRFDECDLTAAVDRPNSWSLSRTRKTSYCSTNNVALIVPK